MKLLEVREKFKAKVKKSPGGTTSVFEMTMPNLSNTFEDINLDEDFDSPNTESGSRLDCFGSDEIRAESFAIKRGSGD